MFKKKLFSLALAGALILTPFTVSGNISSNAAVTDTQSTTAVDTVKLTTVSSVNELQQKIDADLPFVSQEEVNDVGAVHKLVVKQDGWIILKGTATYSPLQYIEVFSNSSLNNKIARLNMNTTKGDSMSVYVNKGNYYYRCINNGSFSSIHTVYAGFIPSSSKLQVKSITLSKDKATAVVKFKTNLDYDTIRTVYENVYYTDIEKDNVWKTTDRKNCAKNLKFTVSKNGTYSSRICPFSSDEMFGYIIKFKVSGIKNKKPATPKVTAYKKNTTVVKGTGTAYTKVYVKANGKTYKSTVDSKGKFSVKTSKLKKGTKVSVYMVNSAGTKGSAKTVKVK